MTHGLLEQPVFEPYVASMAASVLGDDRLEQIRRASEVHSEVAHLPILDSLAQERVG